MSKSSERRAARQARTSGPAPTATATETAVTAGEPQPLAAWLLAACIGLTIAVGAPDQVVLPDTFKSFVAAIGLLATLLAFTLGWARAGTRLPWSVAPLVPLGLAAYAMASTGWAPAAAALGDAARWALVALAAWLAMNLAARGGGFAIVARAAHLGVLVNCAVALLQFWFDFNLFPGDAAPGGTFGNRNHLAEVIAAVLPFSLWWQAQARTQRAVLQRGAGLGLIVLALLACASRAALVAALLCLAASIGLLVAARLRGGLPQLRREALAGPAVALAIVFTLGWIPTGNALLVQDAAAGRGLFPLQRSAIRLASLVRPATYNEDFSFKSRREAWDAGGRMLAAHPLRGVGAGAWNTAVPLYQADDAQTRFLWFAHNEPLQLVAEYGIAGWLALLGLAALLLRGVAKVLRLLARGERLDEALVLGVGTLSVSALVLTSLSGLPLHTASTALLLAIGLGLLSRASAVPLSISGPAIVPGRTLAGAATVLALVLGVQALRSDYHVENGAAAIHALANQSAQRAGATLPLPAAIAELREGLAIRSDHGPTLVAIMADLAKLDDAASALWLNQLMLADYPNLPELKCNLARVQTDLGNHAAAAAALAALRADRPGVPCLPMSDFVIAAKRGQWAMAMALGQRLVAGFNAGTDPQQARYVIDTSYRAAVRVPGATKIAADLLRQRAQRWPELRAASLLLAGSLLASQDPSQVSDEALAAFNGALLASTPDERAAALAHIPAAYRARLP